MVVYIFTRSKHEKAFNKQRNWQGRAFLKKCGEARVKIDFLNTQLQNDTMQPSQYQSTNKVLFVAVNCKDFRVYISAIRNFFIAPKFSSLNNQISFLTSSYRILHCQNDGAKPVIFVSVLQFFKFHKISFPSFQLCKSLFNCSIILPLKKQA